MENLVSIIVPIYNVKDYLDECIESIVGQTYRKLEILLINDGSTDGSDEICRTWEKRDERVRLYSKNNEGLGPTRNYGLVRANGEWVAFIDADDWIDRDYVSIMYSEAMKNSADVCCCSFARIDYYTKTIQSEYHYRIIGEIPCDDISLIYMTPSVCPMLCKRELLIQNGIEQPNTRGQDAAVKLLICALSKNVAFYDEKPLLFYRKGRPGSLTAEKSSNRSSAIESLEYLIEGFIRHELFNTYKYIIKRFVLRHMALSLMECFRVDLREQYISLRKKISDFMNEFFDDYIDYRIATVGGFNLYQIVKSMPYLADANLSFQFSSMISMVNKSDYNSQMHHHNPFRDRMIYRDVTSDIWNVLRSEKPDYLIMDLIEERHDCLKTENGYVTESDAFKGTRVNKELYSKVYNGSDNWWSLWCESCMKFFHLIREIIPYTRIVIVKNLLSEKCGISGNTTNFGSISDIRIMNERLKRQYAFVENRFSEIKMIDISDIDLYFTDREYEYGCFPWHLNTFANEEIAKRIARMISNT